MCIAYLAINASPDWPLFIAANRDEFHKRDALAAAPWPDYPQVIAGIDCVAHGTWLGVTRQGRFGLLTNYRDVPHFISDAPSRGRLVSDYLTGDCTINAYVQNAWPERILYNGFNLIVGDLDNAYYISNKTSDLLPRPLPSGRYVISNHLLDSPWPKALRLRQALDQLPLDQLEHSLTPVFEILKDATQAQGNDLPRTGLAPERERLLSSPFIVSPDYGTRCSTVIAIHVSGRALFSEVSYSAAGIATERHDWPFQIEKTLSACGA